MPNFRKGLSAIEEAANSGGGGKFKPFTPEIRWTKDKQEKFILVVTPIGETVTCQIHEWIPVAKGKRADGSTYDKFEQFISRKDEGIGEDYDDLQDRLGSTPRQKTLGVAVELEPVMEEVQGRKRPKMFTVKTDTYRTREGEEKTAPTIGILSQGQKNFWGWLGSFDNTRAPVTETPISVIRRRMDKDTDYDFFPWDGTEIDLSPLFDHIGNVGYLADEDQLQGLDPTFENAELVGTTMLNKRVDELADPQRYDELVKPIQEYKPRFGGNQKTSSNGSSTAEPNRSKIPAEKRDAFDKLRAEVEATESA